MDVGEIQLQSRLESSTVLWKIENFSSIGAATGAVVYSPEFETTHPLFRKVPWRLEFYPGGYDEANQEYMGLYLEYLGYCQVSVSYSLSIVNEENAKVIECVPDKIRLFKKTHSWGNRKCCLKTDISDEARKELTKDTLLISCTITFDNAVLDDELYDDEHRATAHFQNLLETGDMSDVTFEIENKKMKLHKAIVSSVSPVFLAMFQHQMKEKEESVVTITDVKYHVMEELFRYIYTRNVKVIENIASDLIVAADKYDVKGLKLKCENIVSQSLDVDNALQLLEFAVTYNTTFLKSVVVEFIVSRLEEFVDRPEFEQMNGIYKNELLRAVAKKKSNKRSLT